MSSPPLDSKVLLIFCDGTAFDGTIAEEKVKKPVSNDLHSLGHDSLISHQWATNVLRLSRSVMRRTTDDRRQLVYYQSGIGSDSDFYGKHVEGDWDIQKLGLAVASKIRDAYAFLAQNYEKGDQICLFGFSRGAYTARKLAQLIDKIGLLKTEDLGSFFTIWKALVKGDPYVIPPETPEPRILCVGVWDTVGSIVETFDALHFKDTSLPAKVDHAFHALSVHENLGLILPTLWTVPEKGLSTQEDGNPQVYKQIWFPGAHMDVGGGYERHELADLSLFWMAGEVRELINLNLSFVWRSGQEKPEPWGTSQPINAYKAMKEEWKDLFGHETRLGSGHITPDAIFHPSILESPTQLKDAKYMITLDTMRQRFGAGWPLKLSELNEYEVDCKNAWGSAAGHPIGAGDAPAMPLRPRPVFESPTELFWD